jgi:hypothetical protein
MNYYDSSERERLPTELLKLERNGVWDLTDIEHSPLLRGGDVHVHQFGSSPVVLAVGWDFSIPFARLPLNRPQGQTLMRS